MVAIGDVDVGSESAANRVRKQMIYIFEGRDNLHPSSAGNFSSPMPINAELKQTLTLRLELGSKIEKVCSSPKVFAVVGSFGLVIIYERSDDKHDPYIETRRLSLGKKMIWDGNNEEEKEQSDDDDDGDESDDDDDKDDDEDDDKSDETLLIMGNLPIYKIII